MEWYWHSLQNSINALLVRRSATKYKPAPQRGQSLNAQIMERCSGLNAAAAAMILVELVKAGKRWFFFVGTLR